jgi:hypothetical protein
VIATPIYLPLCFRIVGRRKRGVGFVAVTFKVSY